MNLSKVLQNVIVTDCDYDYDSPSLFLTLTDVSVYLCGATPEAGRPTPSMNLVRYF